MEHSRFPIEVCESIIDQSATIPYLPDRYRMLLACAATCTAWVPRTYFNLYREIALKRRARCDQLLDTLAQHPERVDLWLFEFLPIVPLLAPLLLSDCRELVLGGRYDIQPFPPQYLARLVIPHLALNKSITSLTLVLDPPLGRISDLFRVIGSLPRLQILEWHCRVLVNVKPPEWAQVSRTRLTCRNLKRLTLIAPPLFRIEQFPPAALFGLAIEYLKLKVQYGIWPSDKMLDCMTSWHQLRELEIEFWSTLTNAQGGIDFMRILHHIQPTNMIRLTITLCPTEGSYFGPRARFVDSLAGRAMQQVLGSFDQLVQFRVRLYDNREAFDAAWWRTQLCRRWPPGTKSTVVCEVTTCTVFNDLWSHDDSQHQ